MLNLNLDVLKATVEAMVESIGVLAPGMYVYDPKRQSTGIVMLVNKDKQTYRVIPGIAALSHSNHNKPAPYDLPIREGICSVLNLKTIELGIDDLWTKITIESNEETPRHNTIVLQVANLVSQHTIRTTTLSYNLDYIKPQVPKTFKDEELRQFMGRVIKTEIGNYFTGCVSNRTRILLYDDLGQYVGFSDKVTIDGKMKYMTVTVTDTYKGAIVTKGATRNQHGHVIFRWEEDVCISNV